MGSIDEYRRKEFYPRPRHITCTERWRWNMDRARAQHEQAKLIAQRFKARAEPPDPPDLFQIAWAALVRGIYATLRSMGRMP